MRYLCNTLALALSSALILSCVFMESANKSANTSHPPPPPPPPPKSSSSSSLAKSSSSSKIAVNFLNDKRDGKKYIIVKIGTQTWMAENLKYNAKDSKCYNNKRDNCDAYGRLYDWKTAMSSCPQGWHLPTDGEWNTLVNYAGGKERAGKKLKAKNGWMDF